MSDLDSRCDRCQRMVFMTEKKASWAERFCFVRMEPSHMILRCSRCTRKIGRALSNARPYDGNMRSYEGWGTDWK